MYTTDRLFTLLVMLTLYAVGILVAMHFHNAKE